jgi:ATP-binding cassette subfamily B protein
VSVARRLTHTLDRLVAIEAPLPVVGVRALLGHARPWMADSRRAVAGVVALALVASAASALAPLVVMHFVDAVADVAAAPVTGRAALLPPVLAALAALAAVELATAALPRLVDAHTGRVRLALDLALRARVTARIHQLPLAWHQRQSVGGTITRVNTAVSGLVAAVADLAFKAVPALAYLALAGAALVRLDWRLALVVCTLAPVPALIGLRAAPEQAQRDRALLAHWSATFGRWAEVLAGMRTVKGFAMEAAEERRFLDAVRAGNARVVRGAAKDARTAWWQGLAGAAARLAVACVGGWLVLRGHATVGVIVAGLQYVAGLFAPIQGLTGVYATVRRAGVAVETVSAILEAPDALADAPGARDLVVTAGAVEFRHVSFGYDAARPVLHDVSLVVHPGETVALVGPSGCGKTTLVSLLERLHAPTCGRILIDGQDVGAVTQRSLRRQVGTVVQDVHLFRDTVLANITYGCPGATRADAEGAARAAHAHEFILRLPQGYDTVVGERGAGLSGGQRQRLAIARALLKNPPILVLDEATSALDHESEALVQAALARLTRGRTTIVVAHRVSTVVDADRIVVLRDGHVEDVGTHAELLARGGYYARLFARHARGGLVEPAGGAAGDAGGDSGRARQPPTPGRCRWPERAATAPSATAPACRPPRRRPTLPGVAPLPAVPADLPWLAVASAALGVHATAAGALLALDARNPRVRAYAGFAGALCLWLALAAAQATGRAPAGVLPATSAAAHLLPAAFLAFALRLRGAVTTARLGALAAVAVLAAPFAVTGSPWHREAAAVAVARDRVGRGRRARRAHAGAGRRHRRGERRPRAAAAARRARRAARRHRARPARRRRARRVAAHPGRRVGGAGARPRRRHAVPALRARRARRAHRRARPRRGGARAPRPARRDRRDRGARGAQPAHRHPLARPAPRRRRGGGARAAGALRGPHRQRGRPARRFVGGMLALARRDAIGDASGDRPGGAPEPAPSTDVRALFDDVEALVAARLARRGVRLDATTTVAALAAPRGPLAQILLNLLLNAIEHSPAGARVHVHAEALAHGAARLTVRDRGPGLPPDAADTLFTPFAPGARGTGLGLALVRRVADAHGWRVEAANEAEGGARFDLVLPTGMP